MNTHSMKIAVDDFDPCANQAILADGYRRMVCNAKESVTDDCSRTYSHSRTNRSCLDIGVAAHKVCGGEDPNTNAVTKYYFALTNCLERLTQQGAPDDSVCGYEAVPCDPQLLGYGHGEQS
jgi:hypothetical protein